MLSDQQHICRLTWRQAFASFDLFLTALRGGVAPSAALISQFEKLNPLQRKYAIELLQSGNAHQQETGRILEHSAALKVLNKEEAREAQIKLIQSMATAGFTREEMKATLAAVGLTDAEIANKKAALEDTLAHEKLGKSMVAAMASNPLGTIIMIASIISTIVVPLINKYKQRLDDLLQEYQQEKAEVEDLEEQYKNNCDRIEELIELKKKNDFSEQNAQELQDLRDQNTELAAQLEYKKRMLEIDKGVTQAEANNRFTGFFHTLYDEDGGSYNQTRIDALKSGIEDLETAIDQRQSALEEYYRIYDLWLIYHNIIGISSAWDHRERFLGPR